MANFNFFLLSIWSNLNFKNALCINLCAANIKLIILSTKNMSHTILIVFKVKI